MTTSRPVTALALRRGAGQGAGHEAAHILEVILLGLFHIQIFRQGFRASGRGLEPAHSSEMRMVWGVQVMARRLFPADIVILRSYCMGRHLLLWVFLFLGDAVQPAPELFRLHGGGVVPRPWRHPAP